jgi:hypothetical protein
MTPDEQRLSHALAQIAQEEIPDDMNLLPTLHAAVRRAPRPTLALRLMRAAAMLTLVLGTTLAAYALVQQISGDPGIEAVDRDGRITPIGLTRSLPPPADSGIETLDVTVDYGYADANRITLGVTINGTARGVSTPPIPFLNVTLVDSQARSYNFLPLGGGGGGGGGYAPDELVQFSTSTQINFDATGVFDMPDALDLTLRVDVAMSVPDDPFGMVMAGEAIFNFSLPVQPSLTWSGDVSASASQVTLHLQRIVAAPSLTRMEVCHEMGIGMALTPMGRLTIGGETIFEGVFALTTEMGGQPPSPQGMCRSLLVPAALDALEGEWVLTIEALVSADEPDMAFVQQTLLDEYGIVIELLPGGGFRVTSPQPAPPPMSGDKSDQTPPDVDIGAAIDSVMGRAPRLGAENITGEWVFRVNLRGE